MRAEDHEESLYASIDLVCDKVQRKLRKLKERVRSVEKSLQSDLLPATHCPTAGFVWNRTLLLAHTDCSTLLHVPPIQAGATCIMVRLRQNPSIIFKGSCCMQAIMKGKWPGHGGPKGATPISQVLCPCRPSHARMPLQAAVTCSQWEAF